MRRARLLVPLLGALGFAALAHAQQAPPDEPRSWIPERQAVDDGRTAVVTPPLSEAEKRALDEAESAEPLDLTKDWPGASTSPALRRTDFASVEECVADAAAATVLRTNQSSENPADTGGRVPREFAEPFQSARSQITDGEYLEALPAIDAASQHTDNDPERMLALEQLRTAAFAGLQDQAALLLSLERQLAIGGLSPRTVEAHCRTIQGLRAQIDADNALPKPAR